jgi:hypothetical protein
MGRKVKPFSLLFLGFSCDSHHAEAFPINRFPRFSSSCFRLARGVRQPVENCRRNPKGNARRHSIFLIPTDAPRS